MPKLALESALLSALEKLGQQELAPIEVAVLDSGIDATHPDLVGRVSAAYEVDLFDEQPVVIEIPPDTNHDTLGHGTAVAGIIARIAPNARLVDIKVLGSGRVGAGAAMLAGMEKALERRSKVINISLAATSKFAQKLWTQCETAYQQKQIVVAARRNMPLQDEGFPAEFSSTISVDRESLPDQFSIRYREDHLIEYAAHGVNVRVPAPGGGYSTMTGTSFATPTVSGQIALLLGAWPDLCTFELKTILKAHSHRETDPAAVPG